MADVDIEARSFFLDDPTCLSARVSVGTAPDLGWFRGDRTVVRYTDLARTECATALQLRFMCEPLLVVPFDIE
jgi:hypothetical protein